MREKKRKCKIITDAGVAELADAQDLGSCGLSVGVQVPPPAPDFSVLQSSSHSFFNNIFQVQSLILCYSNGSRRCPIGRSVNVIRGIGIDLCDISRMKKAASQHGFCERVFSPEEIEYASSKAEPAAHYAAAFAAREALAKACGCGIAGMGMDACFVRRTDQGPLLQFSDKFAVRLKAMGVAKAFLSLSHDGGVAAAVVVLEGED